MSNYEDRLRHIRRRAGRNAMDANTRRRMERRRAQQSPQVPKVAAIIEPENLIRTWYRLQRENGQGAGPDGVTFSDLSHRDMCKNMRAVAQELRTGNYRSSRSRQVRIPKPTGGYRVLQLRSIVHRVVAAALNEALAPYWESIYRDCSFGFRRGRNVWHVLATIDYALEGLHCYVVAQDDIRQAFDHVRLADVLAAHRLFISDEQLLSLVETVLGDPHNPDRVGIDQGNPYSPTALNLLLHVHLDVPLTACGDFPYLARFADNLVAVLREVSDGWSFLDQVRQLLTPISLSLKGADGPPVDLRQTGSEVTILGFATRLDGDRIHYGIPESAWNDLEEGLLYAHGTDNSSEMAREVIRGWINVRGPAVVEQWDPVTHRILQTAARHGYREVALKDAQSWVQSSRDRWIHLRGQVHQVLSNARGPGMSRSPTLADVAGHRVMPEAGTVGAEPTAPAPF